MKGHDQSCWYLTGVVIFVLLLLVAPACATPVSAPDTSQVHNDQIGIPGPDLAAYTLTIKTVFRILIFRSINSSPVAWPKNKLHLT
jgi:hypothetical protein